MEEAFGYGFKVVILSKETDRFLRNDENKTKLIKSLTQCIAKLFNVD